MKKFAARLAWALISVAAAFFLGAIAIHRGEPVNSFWIVLAAVCTFLVGYRFYARFIAARVMALNDQRATPAERMRDGRDYEPTNKWILFGHHFAAIAGPGPLVGPTLAAQFGYLPSVYWIIIGAVLGGAVQDFVILFCSMRRDGKSLGQMAREEIGKTGGFTALLTVLFIMIILLAVVALVVVNALKGSPWGTFTIAATMPIAALHGRLPALPAAGKSTGVLAHRIGAGDREHLWRPGGGGVAALAPWFTFSASSLALAVIIYGFLSSVLPVWLLLAPRDYLSTFIKLGVVLMLGAGILFVHPVLALPAFTRFVDGTGPIFAGKVFPFVFITIACGAVSGFHSLISSGTTPKMIAREWNAWPVGYGSMLLEGFVAIMAMIAACSLQPGVLLCGQLAARRSGCDARSRGRDDLGLGLSGHHRGYELIGGRCWRTNAVLSHRRRAVARAGHGAHLFHTGGGARIPRLLVSLRDHVRGAVHSDHHRRRHSRGPLHAAGSAGPRWPSRWPLQLAGRVRHQRLGRAGLGLLPLSRACAILWAASIPCGRCSASPINCWRRSRCA